MNRGNKKLSPAPTLEADRGTMALAEAAAIALGELRTQLSWRLDQPRLIDWRPWRGAIPQSWVDGLIDLVDRLAPSPRRRWALVTSGLPVDVGVARRVQLRGALRGLAVRQFVEVDHAIDWLMDEPDSP